MVDNGFPWIKSSKVNAMMCSYQLLFSYHKHDVAKWLRAKKYRYLTEPSSMFADIGTYVKIQEYIRTQQKNQYINIVIKNVLDGCK